MVTNEYRRYWCFKFIPLEHSLKLLDRLSDKVFTVFNSLQSKLPRVVYIKTTNRSQSLEVMSPCLFSTDFTVVGYERVREERFTLVNINNYPKNLHTHIYIYTLS